MLQEILELFNSLDFQFCFPAMDTTKLVDHLTGNGSKKYEKAEQYIYLDLHL